MPLEDGHREDLEKKRELHELKLSLQKLKGRISAEKFAGLSTGLERSARSGLESLRAELLKQGEHLLDAEGKDALEKSIQALEKVLLRHTAEEIRALKELPISKALRLAPGSFFSDRFDLTRDLEASRLGKSLKKDLLGATVGLGDSLYEFTVTLALILIGMLRAPYDGWTQWNGKSR